MKLKHSKLRNTGLIFELLSYKITSDMVKGIGGDKCPAVKIFKTHFTKNTEILKEFILYKTLINPNNKSGKYNEFLLETVIGNYNKLNKKKLRAEKYNIVKEIKENYDLDKFFKTPIKNYKILATISQLFDHSNNFSNSDTTTDLKLVLLENLSTPLEENIDSPITDLISNNPQEINLLTYKILVEKFNSKYNSLSKKQKNLLREYINNISNTSTLAEYYNKEIDKIKKVFKVVAPKIEDDVTKIKLNEVLNSITYVDNKIKDENVLKLMNYYELADELIKTVKK
jgi:hypothetical protein